MAHTHRQFFVAFLKQLELPVRISGLRALAAVSIFESSQGNEKWNNPLACEQPWPGAKNYNSAGVKIYPTFLDGVAASAAMYGGLHWTGVRSAINDYNRRGRILDAFSVAYTWADVDFRAAPFNNTAALDARLAHPLLGPGD